MTVRRTNSIVTDDTGADAKTEADVIMTAATLGFAIERYYTDPGRPLRLDMDPLDGDVAKRDKFQRATTKLGKAVARFWEIRDKLPLNTISIGLSPEWAAGGVIMGVYRDAGHRPPPNLPMPTLTDKGRQLWENIRAGGLPQYTGHGAYTGFVDNANIEGDIQPVGPLPTARFIVGSDLQPDAAHPRWLPPESSTLMTRRIRRGLESRVPWGMIGGDLAGEPPQGESTATNRADQITAAMGPDGFGMKFVGDPAPDQVVGYTHGMVQAIYKAYGQGPRCSPYEIAVGDITKKLASCIACTFFMTAVGYLPTSIHLGRAESWAPLYEPYSPAIPASQNETSVLRDLNNSWYDRCRTYLQTGLAALNDTVTASTHLAARDAVRVYVERLDRDPSASATLIIDALTIHDQEVERIDRTLA